MKDINGYEGLYAVTNYMTYYKSKFYKKEVWRWVEKLNVRFVDMFGSQRLRIPSAVQNVNVTIGIRS